jgi:hypothetical protein
MDLNAFFDQFAIFNEIILLKRLAIVFIYAILAKGVDIFINRVLRNFATKTKITFDDKLISFLHVPIYWTVFWFGVLHALSIKSLQDPWEIILPQIAQSMILIIWLIAMIRIFNWMVDAVEKRHKGNRAYCRSSLASGRMADQLDATFCLSRYSRNCCCPGSKGYPGKFFRRDFHFYG